MRSVEVVVIGAGQAGLSVAHHLARLEVGSFVVLDANNRSLVNASGTWESPFVPSYPGAATFRGRQLHTVDYAGPAELAGQRVVSVTGLMLRPQERRAAELGANERRPMFARIEPDGVRWDDGSFERADAILWATGFRATLRHLAPLHLRGPQGGIQLVAPFDPHTFTAAVLDPRVQFVGYGPSASTIGANRAGRIAARAVSRQLGVTTTAA